MSVRILAGDCRDMLATMADASVQCVVTSPPYFGLRAYLPEGHADKAREIGTEQTPNAYVAELVAVFREVRRVLRDDGTVWLNLGDSYATGYATGANAPSAKSTLTTNAGRGPLPGDKYSAGNAVKPRKIGMGDAKPKDLLGIPWMVAFALRADGWWLRSDIIWAKPNPMPESCRDRPTSAHEHVFLLSKRASYFYDSAAVREDCSDTSHGGPNVTPGEKNATLGKGHETNKLGKWTPEDKANGRNLRNVWTIATQPYSGAHFATMPPELAERCIKAGTSERGQCPHCAAPWARVVERTVAMTSGSGRSGRQPQGKHAGSVQAESGAYDIRMGPSVSAVTTGWSPTCACPEHKPVPQTVLDPFGGAGTTALVADRLGRNSVLIELNPQYADLARDRLRGDCPMFAEVA